MDTISEPRKVSGKILYNFAMFTSGFRTFFLCGSIFAVLSIGYFILVMSGAITAFPSKLDIISWHRHEMIFGYTGAIIVGFLFTAVPNWTGNSTPKGLGLALIFVLWLAGRLAIFSSSSFPSILVAIIDSSFFVVCAASIVPALIKSKNKRNYFFIVLLLLLALANALTHLESVDIGIKLGLNIVVGIMVIMGGRVIPFFTGRPLGLTIEKNKYLEKCSAIFIILALALDTLGLSGNVVGVIFIAAAIANGIRLYTWRCFQTLRVPLLWILHSGYGWLVVGFFLRALYNFSSLVPYSIATHAFTAGGIGVLTIGMMARVSLGHSGRPLVVGRSMVFSFMCINIAAISRVFGVLLFPQFTIYWLEIASTAWLLGFCIFLFVYTPILILSNKGGR